MAWLLSAYAIVWGTFIVYVALLARKEKRLRREANHG